MSNLSGSNEYYLVERFFDFINDAPSKKLDLWFTLFKFSWLKLYYCNDLNIKFGYKEDSIFGKNYIMSPKA